MNTEEFLKKSFSHVMAQTSRSTTSDGWNCLYAADDGNSCAIGCVLPRELAKQLDNLTDNVITTCLPSTSWSSVVVAAERGYAPAVEAVELLKGVSLHALLRAQQIHDTAFLGRTAADKERIREQFLRLAEELGVDLA